MIAIAALFSQSRAEDSRAETIVAWLAEGRYFDLPQAFSADGSLIPSLGGGPGIALNIDPTTGHGERFRYWWELKRQAEVLSMCGDEEVPFLVNSMRHDDFFVRVIVAMTLDVMLGVDYMSGIGVVYRSGKEELGEDPTDAICDEEVVERDLLQKYVDRAKHVWPEMMKEARQGAPSDAE
jgi:hypothetical protein